MIGFAVGDDLDAACHQGILQAPDRALVAGNDARGEDRGVALLQHEVAVLVIGDAWPCEARGSPWLPVQMNSTLSRGR